MTDDTIQFTASGGEALEVAIRAALAAEGRPPSKARVRTWVRAGDVVVEGRLVTDPGWAPEAGDRVAVTVAPAPGADQAAVCSLDAADAGAGAGCAASIRHLDRHLIVAQWTSPSIVGSDAAVLGAWLRAGLEASGVQGLCPRPIPDPVLRVSGLVAAALTPTSEARLEAARGEGRLGLELTALAEVHAEADTSGLEVADAFPGVVRVVRAGTEGAAEALADLRDRGLAPLVAPGPGPAARRPLLAQVTGLSLPHPTTGRELAWSAPFEVEA